jgi:methionyl-tRNA formyltransferase
MSKENKKNFVFFGGEPLAVRVLEKLKENNLLPDLIVCNPDKPAGRNLVMTPPPTKIWAQKNNIPFIQDLALLKDNFNLFVVVAYGKIIPKEILKKAKQGTINLHPSLLPKYRGPSPIVSAILNGDAETGVTIIKLDEEIDHGPILAQEKIALTGEELIEELEQKLANLAGELLVKVIKDIENIKSEEQDHANATFTTKIKKEDAEIKLTDDPIQNWRKYRAYHRSPRVFFFQNGKRMIIAEARLEDGKFVIKKVIPENGKEITWQ